MNETTKTTIEVGDKIIIIHHLTRTAKVGVLLGESKFKYRAQTGTGNEDVIKSTSKIIPYDETLYNSLRDASMEIQLSTRKFDALV